MADTYNLIFFPRVRDGKDEREVKKKLVKTLNAESEKIDSWFASEKPTVILKEVDDETAEKFMRAILKCGAVCQVHPSDMDGDGLKLVPKQFKTNDVFICPSCEYEAEVGVDEEMERCPKCGLVLSKWREKMDEEKEKERLRRRMQRDQRLKGDEEALRQQMLEELERLRGREREIMTDLGMKVPGRFWLFFEKYPGSVGTALTGLIIILTTVALYYVDQWRDARAHEALVAAEPSEEIKQVAPLLASTVELGQTGNGRMIGEVSSVTRVLHGRSTEETQRIVKAAQQMMKGAENRAFIDAALQAPQVSTMTVPGEGEERGVPVNLDTLGGVAGLTGVERFNPKVLKEMAPPLLEHGHEEILNVMEEKRMVPDPLDPEGPALIVDEIDRLDGSMIVDLMKTLERDQEWDQFLLGYVGRFLNDERIEEASELANRIRNPVLRIEALGDIMARVLLSGGTDLDLKVYMARIDIELERVTEPDIKAMTTLSLGKKLAQAGSEDEPAMAMKMVVEMMARMPNPYEKAFLSSRLAIAHLDNDDKMMARQYFDQAVTLAGHVKAEEDRLSAFTRIARRYYDARNTPLANEILAETAILAATRLPPAERSRIFGEIAMAQGYMGDFNGAMASIDNAGEGEARQQLLSKLAESLIGLERPYLAQSVMARINDNVEYNRLELRLISMLLHNGQVPEAKDRLSRAQTRARQIESLSERGLILSQYARLFARSGQPERANELFAEAWEISEALKGRKSSVNRGLVALDQARSLMMEKSKRSIAEVTESIVKDPVDSQILETERLLKTFMPGLLKEDKGA